MLLTAPKETGGPGTGTNPEQLFAAGYGACFQSALGMVAKKEGVLADGSELEIVVGLGPEGDSFAITADITARIPGVDDATAQRLVEAAHEVCPYSTGDPRQRAGDRDRPRCLSVPHDPIGRPGSRYPVAGPICVP